MSHRAGWRKFAKTSRKRLDDLLTTLGPSSFVYGCVYLLFEAVPIVFIEGHHFNSGESGLIFLTVFVG